MRSLLIYFFSFFLICPVNGQELEHVFQTGHSSPITKIKFNANSEYIASGDEAGAIIIWEIKSGKQFANLNGHKGKITGLLFDSINPHLLFSCSTDGLIIEWEWKNARKSRSLEINDSLQSMIPQNNNSLICAGKSLHFINIPNWSSEDKSVPEIKSPILFCAIDENNNFLAGTADSKINWIDLEKMSLIESEKLRANSIHYSKARNVFYATGNKTILFEICLQKDKIKSKSIFERNLKYGLNCVAETSDYIYASGNEQNIYVFNKKTNFSWFLYGHSGPIISLDASQEGKYIASAGLDSKILVWDQHTHQIITELAGAFLPIQEIKFTTDQKSLLLSFTNGDLKKWNLENNTFNNQKIQLSIARKTNGWSDKFIRFNNSDSNTVNFSYVQFKLKSNGGKIKKAIFYSGKWNTNLNSITLSETELDKHSYRRRTDSILNTINRTSSLLSAYNSRYNFNINVNSLGEMVLYSAKDTSQKIRCGLFGSNGYIFTNSDKYYFGTKDVLPYYNLRVNQNLYNIDQFDVYLNRPDLIFTQLPFFSKKNIEIVRKSVEKRKKQLNVTNDQLSAENILQLPDLITDIAFSTNGDTAILQFQNIPKEIVTISIKVNGVPEKNNEFQIGKSNYSVSIPLSSGSNIITVSGATKQGLHTLTKNYTTKYSPNEKTKSDLYIIGIGAGKYKDSIFNLAYAEKDISDITALFKSSSKYRNVYIESFTNEEVTSFMLNQKIPAFLKNCKQEDVILFFYSGHGVLDKDYEYFLSTYDIDFQNPEINGLSFERLIEFADATPSRYKVCFIDACHSGEVDKEAIAVSLAEYKVEKDVRFRSINTGKKYNSNSSSEAFELSKLLFNDLRENNGTLVFSASGGMQFALETDKLKNGVFTYALQEALAKKKADLDLNKEISIKELEQYLPERVLELTNGYQKANVRIENPQLNLILK